MLRRIFLFLGLNLLIVSCVSVLCDLLSIQPYLSTVGLNIQSLAAFCLIWGIAGSFISLVLSKKIAKTLLKIRLIDQNNTACENEKKLLDIVHDITRKAKLSASPEIGIFESSQCNALATGRSKNSALIAVSSSLLNSFKEDELEGVIAHEMAHITNGDMITMSLLQGVMNAFVMFLSRICAYAVASMNRSRKQSLNSGSYIVFTLLFEMIFLSLGSLLVYAVSRKREYSADKGAAILVGRDKMVSALEALERFSMISKKEHTQQKALSSMMISSIKRGNISRLFSTHPTIEERIVQLNNLNVHSYNSDLQNYTNSPL